MVKSFMALFFAVWMIVTMSGCFPGGSTYSAQEPAGFFSGVWHGWIAPVSLIVGFFQSGIRIYEPLNTGWWYDCGFYIAIIAGFGGLALSRKQAKKNDRS
jgi:hypothetical protein